MSGDKLDDQDRQAAMVALEECGAFLTINDSTNVSTLLSAELVVDKVFAAVDKMRSVNLLTSLASSAVHDALRPHIGRKDFVDMVVTIRDRDEVNNYIAQVTVQDERKPKA